MSSLNIHCSKKCHVEILYYKILKINWLKKIITTLPGFEKYRYFTGYGHLFIRTILTEHNRKLTVLFIFEN